MMTVQELAAELQSVDASRRAIAAQQLATMGEEAAPVAVALAEYADDPACGEWCIATLEDLGPPPNEQASALTELLTTSAANREREQTAYWSATLLGRLGANAASATPALIATAEGSPHPAVSERAVWALGKIGPAAAAAAPTLERLTESDNARLARLATKALREIGSD